AAREAAASAALLGRHCLRALIGRGTQIVVQRMTSSGSEDEERQAVCGLLRHGLVMADGLDELIVTGASEACVPLLRSLFEVWLQIKFMLQSTDPAIRRQRALSWIVAPAAQQLDDIGRFDASSSQGKALLESIASENLPRPIEMPDPKEVGAARQNL